jgi:hypothetical protein
MSAVAEVKSDPIAATTGGAADPKVCMPTWRRFARHAFQSPRYESQDVLADVANVDLIELDAGFGFSVREYWQRRLVWKDFTGSLAFANPGLVARRLEQDYDVFIVTCQTLKELMFVNAIKGWRERCRVSVCILDELFASEVKRSRNFLKLLSSFDYVITEFSSSAPGIADVTGRPCFALPHGVDTIRFSPWPTPPERSIDVHSIGRRRPESHEVLLGMAARGEAFYVYDVSADGSGARVTDHRMHRDLVANIAKRSRCFMVAPAWWDVPVEVRGHAPVASRYFEGAASGAVLLGQPQDTDEFREMFDWPDTVVPVREDGSDTARVLAELKSDPRRMDRISRRNAAEALRRHDWAYRWRELFERIKVPTGPAMRARIRRLEDLAALAAPQGT